MQFYVRCLFIFFRQNSSQNAWGEIGMGIKFTVIKSLEDSIYKSSQFFSTSFRNFIENITFRKRWLKIEILAFIIIFKCILINCVLACTYKCMFSHRYQIDLHGIWIWILSLTKEFNDVFENEKYYSFVCKKDKITSLLI